MKGKVDQGRRGCVVWFHLLLVLIPATGCSLARAQSGPSSGLTESSRSPLNPFSWARLRRNQGDDGPNAQLASNRTDEGEPFDDETVRGSDPLTGERTAADRAKDTAQAITTVMAGRERKDRQRAKELYQQADAKFREASGLPDGADKERQFASAAKLFKRSAEAGEGTAIQQDAVFMQGESLFFANDLFEATDVFQKLQSKFPRNQFNDQVAARLFQISRYWIKADQAADGFRVPVNFTNKLLPRTDTDGHAIRVLDQIRYDDPTGKLADDATMAAAVEYMRQGKFIDADEFLTDLREAYSDSQHIFDAHMLGIECKLKVYRGPQYGETVLAEAQKLIEQTRRRFPEKLREKATADALARASATVAFKRAERLMTTGRYRENKKEIGAARVYYQQVLEDYAETPQADQARTRLAAIEALPENSQRPFAWLSQVFPDSRPTSPLRMKSEYIKADGKSESSRTFLR